MPVKFNGNWSVKMMRPLPPGTSWLPPGTSWLESLDISVASYVGTQFTFRMRIKHDSSWLDIDLTATDVADRFIINQEYGQSPAKRRYTADVRRFQIQYGEEDEKTETFLIGFIKRTNLYSRWGGVTDPDTVSFTAVKTG